MSKKDKPKSRWNVGNVRYDKATQASIDKVLREAPGWHNGARVWKK